MRLTQHGKCIYRLADPPFEKVLEDKFLPHTMRDMAPMVENALDIVELSVLLTDSF